jgi:hypothetical protein
VHRTRNFSSLLILSIAWIASGAYAAAGCIPDLAEDPPGEGDAAAPETSGFESGSSSGSSSSGSTWDADSDAASGSSSSGGPAPVGCGDGYIDLSAGEQCDNGQPGVSAGGCSVDCKVLCSGFTWSGNNHCYELIPQTVNSLTPGPSTASGKCQALIPTAHVVTFASDNEFRAVTDSFADAGASPFWIALQAEPGYKDRYGPLVLYEPGWWTDCSGCYAHTADPTSALQPAKPNDPMALCVQASTDQKQWWTAIDCTAVNPVPHVLCEREPVGAQSRSCAGGSCIEVVTTHGRKRYVYHDTPSSADDAELACVNAGGRLVVPWTRDEREQLWHELGLGGVLVRPSGIWIGLSQGRGAPAGDDGGTGTEAGDASWDASAWVWDDGMQENAYASPWAGNEPHTAGTGLTTRAYMTHVANLSDDTLAHNVVTLLPNSGLLPFVCEMTGPDAGL